MPSRRLARRRLGTEATCDAGARPPVVDARGHAVPGAGHPAGPGRPATCRRARPCVLLADDVAAWSDVPAWARMKGHTVTLLEDDDWTEYRVVLGARRTERGQADRSS